MIALVRAVVGDDGMPILDWDRLLSALIPYAGKRIELIARLPKKPRTLRANAYYWFVVTLIANEIGETVPERVHDGLRHKYLVRSDEGGIPKVASTTELTTTEFAHYVDSILTDAATGDLIGSPMWIPRPGEGDAPAW